MAEMNGFSVKIVTVGEGREAQRIMLKGASVIIEAFLQTVDLSSLEVPSSGFGMVVMNAYIIVNLDVLEQGTTRIWVAMKEN